MKEVSNLREAQEYFEDDETGEPVLCKDAHRVRVVMNYNEAEQFYKI